MSGSGRCERCGGTRPQHLGDVSCWCPTCLDQPRSERCGAFIEPTAPVVPPAAPPPPPRERGTTPEVLPKRGTLGRKVYETLADRGWEGGTDEEIEKVLRKAHQSVSAARNALVKEGLVRDSGMRRPTATGKSATVWLISDDDALGEPDLDCPEPLNLLDALS